MNDPLYPPGKCRICDDPCHPHKTVCQPCSELSFSEWILAMGLRSLREDDDTERSQAYLRTLEGLSEQVKRLGWDELLPSPGGEL